MCGHVAGHRVGPGVPTIAAADSNLCPVLRRIDAERSEQAGESPLGHGPVMAPGRPPPVRPGDERREQILRRDDLGIAIGETPRYGAAARRRARRPHARQTTDPSPPRARARASRRRPGRRSRSAAASSPPPDHASSPGRRGPQSDRGQMIERPAAPLTTERRLICVQAIGAEPIDQLIGATAPQLDDDGSVEHSRRRPPDHRQSASAKARMIWGSCVSAAQRRI